MCWDVCAGVVRYLLTFCALFSPDTCKYFGCELGAQTQMDTKVGRYIVNGAHEGSKLQDMLDGFIRKFVLCPECDNPETELVRARGDCRLVRKVIPLLSSDCAAKSQSYRTDVQGMWLPWPSGHAPQAHNFHPQEPTWASGGGVRKEVGGCL